MKKFKITVYEEADYKLDIVHDIDGNRSTRKILKEVQSSIVEEENLQEQYDNIRDSFDLISCVVMVEELEVNPIPIKTKSLYDVGGLSFKIFNNGNELVIRNADHPNDIWIRLYIDDEDLMVNYMRHADGEQQQDYLMAICDIWDVIDELDEGEE